MSQQPDTCYDPEDCPKTRDMERLIDRADWLRDERRDREMAEREAEREQEGKAP